MGHDASDTPAVDLATSVDESARPRQLADAPRNAPTDTGHGVQRKPFSSFRFSAFMSYAHDDDAAWNCWISSFSGELDMALGPRLRGIRIPRCHLSSKN